MASLIEGVMTEDFFREDFGDREAWLLLLYSFLFLAAATAVRIFGALVASNNVLWVEGLHVLLDTLLSLFIIVPVVVVRSSLSERYPYGLYRLEDVVALLIAAIIVFTVYLDVGEVFTVPGAVSPLVVGVQAASLPLLLAASLYKRRAGVRLRSPTLIADASHVKVDVVEGGAVLVGLLAYLYTGIVGLYTLTLLVALLGLLFAAYEAGFDSLKALLDLPKDGDALKRMREAAAEALGSEGKLVSFKARWAGPAVFVEAVVRLHPLTTIEESSIVAQRIARAVRSSVDGVKGVAVTVEPVRRARMTVAVPVDGEGAAAKLSRHFGKARFFLLAEVAGGKIVETRFVAAPSTGSGEAEDKVLRGARVAEWLHKLGVTDVITCNIGEIAFSILLRHHIVLWRGECGKSVGEILRLLAEGALARMKEPTREESWEK